MTGPEVQLSVPETCLSIYNQLVSSTQPGHPSVGKCNEYQPKGGDALWLGVKAGMVREWVAGKTVLSPCYHAPHLSALEMNFFIIRRYANRRRYFTLLLV